MLRSQMFREHAAHCFAVAQSLSEDERPLMLQMAQSWLNLAQLAEKHEGGDEPSPSLFPQDPASVSESADLD
jgi:hypothetical protein